MKNKRKKRKKEKGRKWKVKDNKGGGKQTIEEERN